jgi:hypothetical protein
MHQIPNHRRPPSPPSLVPTSPSTNLLTSDTRNPPTLRQFFRIRHRYLPSREFKRHCAGKSSRILLLPRKTQREPGRARNGDPE